MSLAELLLARRLRTTSGCWRERDRGVLTRPSRTGVPPVFEKRLTVTVALASRAPPPPVTFAQNVRPGGPELLPRGETKGGEAPHRGAPDGGEMDSLDISVTES